MSKNRRKPLYHFTCSHGAEGLGRSGFLNPTPHPLLGSSLSWMTSLPDPARDAVGLTSTILDCDRMETRWKVTDQTRCRRWVDIRHEFNSDAVEILEAFSDPSSWWVASVPVPVRLARDTR